METLLLYMLGALSIVTVSLQRTYSSVNLKELKRRAREGDTIAAGLIKATSYGHSLRALLWVCTGLASAGFFVLVSRNTPLWFALSACALLLWFSLVWIPAAKVSVASQKLAAILAPVLGRLLSWLHPIVDRLVRLIRRFKPLHIHTGLYDKYDLVDLLEQQEQSPGNRIDPIEIDLAKHALLMSDVLVRDRMIPRRKIRMVSLHDNLGPIILDELHASGFSRFPVYDGKQDNIVGTLYLKDLVRAHKSSNVKSLMRQEVYYVHEDQTIHDALQAVLKTHHHLFMVVNEFEEITGIISSEDIFEALLGQPIKDEFDAYDNLRAVAALEAQKTHEERTAQETEPVQPVTAAEEDPDADEVEVDGDALLAESTEHEPLTDDIETIELDK